MRSFGLLLLCALVFAAETGTIEGRLLNGDGTPWAGAQITAYKLGEKEPWKRVADTDEEGRFRITDLPPGRYVLRSGPKPKPQPKTDNPFGELFKGMFEQLAQIPLADAPEAITLEAGQTLHREIRLPKHAPVRFVLTKGGKPVAGAEVEVFRVDADNNAGWTVTVGEKRRPRTDKAGIVSLGEIDEGRYAVEFMIAKWEVYGGVHEVKGSEPHSFPVDLGVHTIPVKVLDANGKPAPEASVTISWGETDWDFVRPRDMKQIPGDAGVFRVPYVRAGKIDIWINGPNNSLGSRYGIEVGPENPAPEVVVSLDLAVLTIRVVDAKGGTVPGVHVRIENADDEKGMPAYAAETNHRGEVLQAVKVRRWRVRIEDSDRGTGEWTIVKPEISEHNAVDLTVPESR